MQLNLNFIHLLSNCDACDTTEISTVESSTVERSTVEESTVERSTVERSTVESSTVENSSGHFLSGRVLMKRRWIHSTDKSSIVAPSWSPVLTTDTKVDLFEESDSQ